VKRAVINVESSKTSFNQARGNWLPDVSGSLSDGFSFGRAQTNEGIYFEQNVTNSANVGVNLEMSLFDGRISSDIKAKKYSVMAASEDQQKVKNSIILNVASLYLNILIQKELQVVAREQIVLSDSLEKNIERLVNCGREPQSKLYEILAQKANENYNLTSAEKNLRIAFLDLMQMLEVDDPTFDIEEPFFDIDIMTIPLVVFEQILAVLPDVKAEKYRLNSLQKSLNMVKASYYPSLFLSASTSTGYYHYYQNRELNVPFLSQLSNNWKSYVGLSMNIPIFNRLEAHYNVKLSKIQIRQQEMEVENARKTLLKDVQRAQLNAEVSKQRYTAANLSVQMSEVLYRHVEERFRVGHATSFDLQQAKNNLEKSLSERIQAKYEFIFNVKILDFYNGKEIKF
jgi:outer membrane protein